MPRLPVPHILLILADNLGWGELGCYGGGLLRGAPTPRLDALASQGLRLLNFNVECACVPTRAALMTGRHPIRTGSLQAVAAGLPQGLIPWEITLAQLLSAQGYATAIHGKWHLGDRPGRYPTDRGFDEWYGIPRTTNEVLFPGAPGFDPTVVPLPYVMEARRGEPARNVRLYDLEMRRLIDAELVSRAIDFMHRQTGAQRPFFAYVPITQLHYPTLPHPEFVGTTGAGEFADALAEMDHRVGQLLDELDRLGIADDTVVIFASDNGPEFRRPWRGTAGPWSGTYHTALEGGLRVPCLLRWPGRIPAGRVSNEIVHVADLYPTLARIAGAAAPTDRLIDGVDQLDFFLGRAALEPRGLRLLDQGRDPRRQVAPLEDAPDLGGRAEHGPDPAPVAPHLQPAPGPQGGIRRPRHSWARGPLHKLIDDFLASLRRHPPIPPGAPDDYVPAPQSEDERSPVTR